MLTRKNYISPHLQHILKYLSY